MTEYEKGFRITAFLALLWLAVGDAGRVLINPLETDSFDAQLAGFWKEGMAAGNTSTASSSPGTAGGTQWPETAAALQRLETLLHCSQWQDTINTVSFE